MNLIGQEERHLRVFALPSKFSDLGTIHISKSLAGGLKLTGVLILYGIVAYFALWVFYHFITNVKMLRREALEKEG